MSKLVPNNGPPGKKFAKAALRKAQPVRLLALDVDGVLTDGKLYLGAQGEMLKTFNSRDGHGIKMLHNCGIEVAIITGRQSPFVLRRAAELKIDCVLQGREDKWPALQSLAEERKLSVDELAYMGDDWPDLAAIIGAGLGCSVVDAAPEVRDHADWVSTLAGGQGAVRELCDLLMVAQNRYEEQLKRYTGDTAMRAAAAKNR